MDIRFERQRSTGLYLPKHTSQRRDHPTAFEFFAGAGGAGCGLIQAGFEIVGANEYDASAALTYMVNLGHYPMKIHYIDGDTDKARLDRSLVRQWGLSKKEYKGELEPEMLSKVFGDGIAMSRPNRWIAGGGWISGTEFPGVRNFWFGDVRQLRGADILDALEMREGDLDLVMGGPPCQGYSKVGQQIMADPRNNLVYEYGRLIVELQPKTFVMEEVPNIVDFFDPDGVPVLDKFCLMIAEGGYGKWENIRKALLMQSGCAGVIKSGMKGNAKVKPATKTIQTERSEAQGSLF